MFAMYSRQPLPGSPGCQARRALLASCQASTTVEADPGYQASGPKARGLVDRWSPVALHFAPALLVESNEKRMEALRRLSEVAGIATFVIGAIAMTGWILGVDFLKSVVPGLITMKANWPDPVLRSTCCESWVDVLPAA